MWNVSWKGRSHWATTGLTVGQHAHINGAISAAEVVVFGNVRGNLLARDRIEIKNHGSVVGRSDHPRESVSKTEPTLKGSIEIARKAQARTGT